MILEQEFSKQFLIPVIRQTNEKDLLALCQALADGGLRILEITLMSDAAFDVIEKLTAQKNLIIGAGTILNLEQSKRAINSGAQFLVSPGIKAEVVRDGLNKNVTFIPGVLTPSEVMLAQELGCEMVKIFPAASIGGPSYIKNLQGPFPKMKWMATGGINLEDIPSYRQAGVTCVGLGGNLTPKNLLDARDWKGISKHVSDLLKKI